jgi:hypothetical protein
MKKEEFKLLVQKIFKPLMANHGFMLVLNGISSILD